MRDFDDFPKEIQQKMLDIQEAQGNKRDPESFKPNADVDKAQGGFNWCDSLEGWGFWDAVISYSKYEVFFEKYPKNNS